MNPLPGAEEYLASLGYFKAFQAQAEATCHMKSPEQWLTQPAITAATLLREQQGAGFLSGLDSASARVLVGANIVAGLWAACGFPTVRIGHGAACGLMATNGNSEDLSEMVRAPWPAFAVRLPEKLIWFPDGVGGSQPASTLFVCEFVFQSERLWVYNVGDENDSIIWSSPTLAKSMWEYNADDWLYSKSKSGTEAEAEGTLRSSTLVRRLIAGICLQLSSPEDKEGARIGKPASVRNRNRMPGELPATDNYEVRLSVKIDERVVAATREYARHGGRSPTVQSLVRGHWKKQAHGPERSLRKMIYVAPFWRGPIDAPISMRVAGKLIKDVKEPGSGSSE